MPDTTRMGALISVAPRFARSVSIDRDWCRLGALDGYVLTDNGREILRRLAKSLRAESPTRAWTITGPYGVGKSAILLFVANVLAGDTETADQVKRVLRKDDPSLYRQLFTGKSPLAGGRRLCPVLAVGSRTSLDSSLALALASALRAFSSGKQAAADARKLERLAKSAASGSKAKSIVEAYESALKRVSDGRGRGCGLLLIIDELGKHLEFAAAHPDDGDVFILQALAEAAARADSPFLVLTSLHQSLDLYAEHISNVRRQEWAKVQGRFEDLAFEEPPDQVLRLMAKAVRHGGDKATRTELSQWGRKLAGDAWRAGLRSASLAKPDFVQVLSAAVPLHPTVATILGPLFRRLAQNERSLFAFLSSGEPFGFQEFLTTTPWNASDPQSYRCDRLYDYVASSMGASLYAESRGKHWAEVRSVMDRLHDADELHTRIAKTIGLLQAVGYAAGVPASREWIRLALRSSAVSSRAIDKAIDSLEKQSVIVYRRHADSYALWEGSDVDIDSRMEDARRAALDPARSLASFLAENAPLNAIVARKHYFRTGTLRYFDATFADAKQLAPAMSEDLGAADGRVVFCVPLTNEDRKGMLATLTSKPASSHPATVVAVPSELVDLKELCSDLACLNWIEQNTPELQGDATARRELRARLSVAHQKLVQLVREIFIPSGNRKTACHWYCRGKRHAIANARSLNELLSDICEKEYPSTPTWRNELVNRRQLSSSAAKARRNLIESIIERSDQEFLGISGTPAERSMYDSLLRATGLHRCRSGTWGFYPPTKSAEPALRAVWAAVSEFLADTEKAKRTVAELFGVLRQSPFGLKDGVLPIILAAVLRYYDTEVALYEEGSFVPILSTPVFERLLQAPERFQIQRCRIAGPRAVVFEKYAELLIGETQEQSNRPQLLGVVRPLHRLVRSLPEYVLKTHELTLTASQVLRAVLQAREPDQLLFHDLPAACDVSPFASKGRPKRDQIDAFFGSLRVALGELQQAYPKLQARVEQLLKEAFRLEGPLDRNRKELAHRARLVAELTVDARLKAFVARVTASHGDDDNWLEMLAALIAGKPTAKWNDDDRARFELNLSLTARTFHHFEAIAFEAEESGVALLDGDHRAIRLGITTSNAPEVERVVRIPNRLAKKADKARTAIEKALATTGLIDNTDVSVAVLAEISRRLLEREEE